MSAKPKNVFKFQQKPEWCIVSESNSKIANDSHGSFGPTLGVRDFSWASASATQSLKQWMEIRWSWSYLNCWCSQQSNVYSLFLQRWNNLINHQRIQKLLFWTSKMFCFKWTVSTRNKKKKTHHMSPWPLEFCGLSMWLNYLKSYSLQFQKKKKIQKFFCNLFAAD